MKFLVILTAIIATVVYIFVSGPKGMANLGPEVDRFQDVRTRIGMLEAKRRDMLIRADMRMGRSSPRRPAQHGPWGQGYQAGFDQGYMEGSYLAESRQPNPLFFPIPNP